MSVLKVMLFKERGRLSVRGGVHDVPRHCLIVAETLAVPMVKNPDDCLAFAFCAGDIQALYAEFVDLLAVEQCASPFFMEPVRQIDLSEQMSEVVATLGGIDRKAMFRFVMAYCIGYDQEYFSRLMRHFVNGSREFFEFIEKNSYQPWTVGEYAEQLGMSVRKLNMLFYENCSVSAKHWLLERRLKRARELLLGTSMKVTDVAQECGFNSHAHFSDSFRRRYNDCPRQIRKNNSTDVNVSKDE